MFTLLNKLPFSYKKIVFHYQNNFYINQLHHFIMLEWFSSLSIWKNPSPTLYKSSKFDCILLSSGSCILLSFLQQILTRLDFLGNGKDNEMEYEMLTTNSAY